MLSIETWIGLLGGALGLVVSLGGVIFTMLRTEAKEHADLIKEKADESALNRMEVRWQGELNAVREQGEKLVGRLEARHERDLETMHNRITEQIKMMESNILSQFRLAIEVIQKKRD